MREAAEMLSVSERTIWTLLNSGQAGWANSNLRTQLLKIIRRAGVTKWNRLFHSLRASRQTELERDYPLHVVCAWLGNTEAVAQESYLLVTDADFEMGVQSGTKSGTVSTRNEPHDH